MFTRLVSATTLALALGGCGSDASFSSGKTSLQSGSATRRDGKVDDGGTTAGTGTDDPVAAFGNGDGPGPQAAGEGGDGSQTAQTDVGQNGVADKSVNAASAGDTDANGSPGNIGDTGTDGMSGNPATSGMSGGTNTQGDGGTDTSTMNGGTGTTTPTTTYRPPGSVSGGIEGGHFDVDTSDQVYAFGHGETNKHIHEYDDKFDTTGIDAFGFADPALEEIAEKVAPTRRFKIIVANAQLSPGGVIEINGVKKSVTQAQSELAGLSQVFTLGTPTVPGDVQLTSLKLFFELDAIAKGGLIATETSCVQHNDAGLLGEYRNGALVVQIMDADTAALNPATGTATAASNSLLWEVSVFYHDTGCYK